jgi:hypothetical protein
MPCTKETPRCANARDYTQDLPECCRSHIREMMRVCADVLRAHGVTWWIDYGSLLGLVRNPMTGQPPGILHHDKDADCGILATEQYLWGTWGKPGRGRPGDPDLGKRPFTAGPIVHDLEAAGLQVGAKAPHPSGWMFGGGDRFKVRWSKLNHTNIDFFTWYERPGGLLYRERYIAADQCKGREFPTAKCLPTVTVTWEGIEVQAPADPKWFCQHRYGNDWRREVKANHDGQRR